LSLTNVFLNSILGAFGLVTTSVETLNKLQASQQIVEQMKTSNKAKKLKATKTFAKRSTSRVASGSLAAATIGTVAVAVTMVSFEVYDYCDEQKAIQDDANILYGTSDDFNFEQCLEQGQQDSKQILIDVKDSASESVTAAFDSTVEYTSEKWAELKESSNQAFKATEEVRSELMDFAKELLPE